MQDLLLTFLVAGVVLLILLQIVWMLRNPKPQAPAELCCGWMR